MEESYEQLMISLLNTAIDSFNEQSEGKLLKEKLEQINNDCTVMLAKNEIEFVYDCFETIEQINNAKLSYIYRCGIRDCVSILKSMGVLA